LQVFTLRGDENDARALAVALDALGRGELLIYPTDTLYALGGRARDSGAVARVRAVKGREAGKPLPVIAADIAQARALSQDWTAAAERLAQAFWPGPLTLVVRSADDLPHALTAGVGSVAVRVPALPLARTLCADGALVSTSANLAGGAPPVTCDEAVAVVGEGAALALDAGPGSPRPSTIVDLTSSVPRLLRDGAVPWPAVEAILLSAAPC